MLFSWGMEVNNPIPFCKPLKLKRGVPEWSRSQRPAESRMESLLVGQLNFSTGISGPIIPPDHERPSALKS